MIQSIPTSSSNSRLLLIVLVLAIMNIDQIQGLSGGFFRQCNTSTSSSSTSSSIVSRGSRGSIWGKRSSNSRIGKENNIINNQSNNYELPTTQKTVVSTTATTTIKGQPLSTSSFDANSYRQQMTELVYQRNLQRCV